MAARDRDLCTTGNDAGKEEIEGKKRLNTG
jgi:hypothetical protein